MVRLTKISCLIGSFLLLAVISAIFFTVRPQAAQGAKDSCPLNSQQKARAVKAFKGLASVFKEPRCLNCHGAVNPFSTDGGHGGGYINIREETKKFLQLPDFQSRLTTGSDPTGSITAKTVARLKEIAESPTEISDNDLIRLKAFDPMRSVCKECHIFSWIIPMRHNHFVGRSAKEMYVHMKTSALTNRPDLFLRHMQDDELVLEGFKGRKGLLEAGAAEPPQMSFATFVKYANDWIAAMNGKFHQPPDCGCTAEGIVLEVRHRIQADPQAKGGFAAFDGSVQFDILLQPYAEGWFRGEIDVVRPMLVRHITPSFWRCSGSGLEKEHWLLTARVDPNTESMDVQFGYVTCRAPNGMTTIDDLYVDLPGSLESVHMSTKTGTKKDVNVRNFEFLEWVSVEVVEGLDEQTR
jgi:hypothetical protein